MKFYDDVREIKQREVAALAGREAELKERAGAAPPPRSLRASLEAADPAIIAEIKRASPSKGVFAPALDASAQARRYAAGGARGISVLTEEVYFKGSLEDLALASSAVSVPVLRKDFILDRRQILAARAHGADAVLLIVGFLETGQLTSLLSAVRETGMEALVEVHDEAELDVAVAAGARIIGINNRNLRTLTVDLAVSERMLPLVPSTSVAVVESGIHGVDDITRLRRVGARAFLIGEHLARSGDPAQSLRDLCAE